MGLTLGSIPAEQIAGIDSERAGEVADITDYKHRRWQLLEALLLECGNPARRDPGQRRQIVNARTKETRPRLRVPDLRAHGLSDKPHDPIHYPKDILANDQFALIDHLGLGDFDLGGYSLGGRTVARMLAKGCTPRRVVISGMGLEGLSDTGKRAEHFRNVLENLGKHERGSAAFMAEAFLKTTGGDPVALLRILDTFVDTPEDVLRSFDFPIGVICGDADSDNGSAAALAELVPRGQLITVPGNHMSAVIKAELGLAIRDFLLEEGI